MRRSRGRSGPVTTAVMLGRSSFFAPRSAKPALRRTLRPNYIWQQTGATAEGWYQRRGDEGSSDRAPYGKAPLLSTMGVGQRRRVAPDAARRRTDLAAGWASLMEAIEERVDDPDELQRVADAGILERLLDLCLGAIGLVAGENRQGDTARLRRHGTTLHCARATPPSDEREMVA
jgi:hypothetical protein